MKFFKSMLMLTSAAALLAAAQAQEAAPAEENDSEEIVVTAEKRAQSIQKVPISMSVMRKAEVERYNTSTFASLQNYTPNLLVQPSPANDAIFIRGFGSQAANYAFDQSVSLYQDGVYGGRARQFMNPFFDVERVEVLRGPQGALLGKNTAAGAVSIITANPTDELTGSITGLYNFDRNGFDAYGYLSGPLSDTLGARVAVKVTDMDGYIPNTISGRDDPSVRNAVGRVTFRYEPSENFDLTAKFEYASNDTREMNLVAVSITTPQDVPDTRTSAIKFGMEPRDKQISRSGVVIANFYFNDYTLTSTTGYSGFEDTKVFYGGVNANTQEYAQRIGEEFEQVSQELLLLSPRGNSFEWMVGAYVDYSDDAIRTYQRYNIAGVLNGDLRQEFDQEQRTWSAFAQGTYHLTEDLSIAGTARYTEIWKSGAFQQLPGFGYQLSPSLPRVTGEFTESHFDPSLTLQYSVSDTVMLYATVAQGSKGGGFVSNIAATTTSTFKYQPEKSLNYEIGAKTTLFDGAVIANISLFQLQFDDLQVSVYDPTLPGFRTKNAASATSRGVEGYVMWRPTEGLTLSTSFAYLDAKYDDFAGAACLASQPPTCVAATNNLAGMTIFGASKWTGNLQADYHVALTGDLELSLNLVASYRSKFVTSTNASPIYGVQEGYTKIDARIGIGQMDGGWGLALVGKNITDEKTAAFSYLWPLATPPQALKFLDETRTISLEARYRF